MYLARDIYLETLVAIKGIRPDLARNNEFRARILAEGKAMAEIDHENVVRLNSVVVQPDELFLVMQYVDGESLDKTIARYATQQAFMPVDHVLRIFGQILAGVGAAHANGMIHRDIKPANILVSRVDSRVKVTDFGIAKAEDEAHAGKGLTRTDGLIGSVLYMSPERIQGERNLDRRVDIYALGIMLFEMLAGRVPFDGPTVYATMNMHVRDPIPSITFIRSDVPDYVRSVIEKACAKSRDLRFGSAVDMATALRAPGSVARSADPEPLPVTPEFPVGANVAPDPFVGVPGAGVVHVPRRAISPTEIAMAGDFSAARLRETPPDLRTPPQEQHPAKHAAVVAPADEFGAVHGVTSGGETGQADGLSYRPAAVARKPSHPSNPKVMAVPRPAAEIGDDIPVEHESEAAAIDDDIPVEHELEYTEPAADPELATARKNRQPGVVARGFPTDPQLEIDRLCTVLKRDPANSAARGSLKKLYRRAGYWSKLVDLLQHELDTLGSADKRKRLAVLREMAQMYRDHIKNDAELVIVLQQVLQLDDHDVDAVRELCRVYQSFLRWSDLSVHQRKLAELSDDLPEKISLLRTVARRWAAQCHNIQNAIDAYERLLSLAPRDREAMQRLIELYRRRRKSHLLFPRRRK